MKLAHRVDGPPDAPWLVLITGYGGQMEGWFRQVPHFSRSFRVLTFDNRGAGRSPSIDEPTSMRDLAQDAIDLMDAVGAVRAHVWGVSMGGKIAMELALGWPDRVDRLVLENTTAGAQSVGHLREAHRADETEWLERIVPLLFGPAYRAANASSMRAFARSRARHPPDPIGMQRQYEAYSGFDARARLREITQPTLVIVGTDDAMTDPAHGEAIAAQIADARLVRIAGGHSVHIENPAEVNTAVEQFLLG